MGAHEDPDSAQSPNSQGTDKQTIRKALRARRRARRDETDPMARAAQARRACTHVAEHPAMQQASCIATYEPLPTEEDVSYLTDLLGEGVRYLVPITLEDLDLSWRDVATGEDLGRDGISLADVIVAPALAVGPSGQRLGQGGGSYDRALPRRSPKAPVIAVVFSDEIGVAFSSEAHDEPVDAVATADGLTLFHASEHGTSPHTDPTD